MYPFPNKPPLTYHEDKKRWKKDRRGALLQTVDIGQEFGSAFHAILRVCLGRKIGKRGERFNGTEE
jgi:hypothetical protein